MHHLLATKSDVADSPMESVAVPTLTTRMMVGTSPGKYRKHMPAEVPLDAVTYMLRADLAAKERGAEGIFLALDRRDPSEGVSCPKDAAVIAQRTEHLRELVSRLTGLTYVTETELDDGSLSDRRSSYPLEMFRGTPYPSYYQRQTAVVMETLGANEDDPSNAALSKFGWIITRDDAGNPQGGEVEFDSYLPGSQGIECAYTSPGYMMNGQWAVPYLATADQRPYRIILPRDRNQLDRELRKLDNRDLSGIAYYTMASTAQVLLGQARRETIQAPRINALPVSPDMKASVDAKQITELRHLLAASLTKLLP